MRGLAAGHCQLQALCRAHQVEAVLADAAAVCLCTRVCYKDSRE